MYMGWIIVICLVIVSASDNGWLDKFQAVMTQSSTFDLALSKKLLNTIPNVQLLNLPVNSVPLVHQMMNMYMLCNDVRKRKGVIEVLIQCINLGANVDTPFNADPHPLFKAIVIREMVLAEAIANKTSMSFLDTGNTASSTDIERFDRLRPVATLFSQLYSLTCEPIPLAKLLLHAGTFVRSKPEGIEAFGGVAGLKNMISTASPGANAKPSVRGGDLSKLSLTYDHIIHQLGDFNVTALRLQDILSTLDDVGTRVQFQLIRKLTATPERLLNFRDLFCSPLDTSGRNLFHYLAIAGASRMLHEVVAALQAVVTSAMLASPENALLISKFHSALAMKDVRGLTPVQYATLRFGVHSPVFAELSNLLNVVQSPLTEAERDLLVSSYASVHLSNAREGTVDSDDSAAAARRVRFEQLYRHDQGGWALSPDEFDNNYHHQQREQPKLNEIIDVGNDGLPAAGSDARDDVHVADGTNDVFTFDYTRCDIEERWDGLPTAADFVKNYVHTGTPVIFRGAAVQSSSLRQAFAKDNFLERYGNDSVTLSTIPYASSFGLPGQGASMREVVELMFSVQSADVGATFTSGKVPLYAFSTAQQSWHSKIQVDAPMPECIREVVQAQQRDGSMELQFYLGGKGSGAPAHFHGHAINSLAYGQKRWFVYPPSEAFYSTVPALPFVRHDPLRASALQCTQHSGDVMFVPTLWGHLTLNTMNTIGVAHEFSVESFCME